ncbi:MAG: ROK family protein [Jatrophihabitans sp.]
MRGSLLGTPERRGAASFVREGQQHADMRRRNEAAVLRAVLANAPVPRTDIARLTQLSAPSVTKVASWLVKAGFLYELPTSQRPENGRPAVPLAIDPRTHVAVGVHIGFLRTTIGVVGLDGSLLQQFELSHASLSPDAILDELVEALDGLWPRIDSHSLVAGIGVSMGGLIDAATGLVISHETLGWHDVAVVDQLAYRVPHPVWLGVNYRALAEAEMWFGEGRDVDDFLMIFVGNVTGAAIVSGRRLHQGVSSRAGTIAHTAVPGYEDVSCACGRFGCLQAVASDIAIVARAEAAGIACDGSLPRLIELGRQGLAAANELLEERARAVGKVIGPLIDLLDPARVVLAGGLVSGPEHLDVLRDTALALVHAADLVAADIVETSFGPASLVVSSAAPVLRSVFDDPAAYSALSRKS